MLTCFFVLGDLCGDFHCFSRLMRGDVEFLFGEFKSMVGFHECLMLQLCCQSRRLSVLYHDLRGAEKHTWI